MRVKRITPKIFGRFKGDCPLDIPNEPMVVIYGRNESGKSSYLDLVVALLSRNYDARLLGRYGDAGERISGEIVLAEDGEELTVSFKGDAKVPKKASVAPRSPKPQGTRLWNRIENLELANVRNLFRVSALDISDGENTKKKFMEYSLGDRAGQSVSTAIEELRSERDKAKVSLEKKSKNARDVTEQIGQVTTSLQKSRELEQSIRDRKTEIEETQRRLNEMRTEVGQIEYANGIQGSHRSKLEAKSELDRLSEIGRLIPLPFSQHVDLFRKLVAQLEDLDLAAASKEVDRLDDEIEALETRIEQKCSENTFDRTTLTSNPVLADDKHRALRFNNIRSAYATLKTSKDSLGKIDVGTFERDVCRAEADLEESKRIWNKFNLGKTAYEFLANPETEGGKGLNSRAEIGSVGSRLFLTLILLGLAVVSFTFDQTIGAIALGGTALWSGWRLWRDRNADKFAVEVDHPPTREEIFNAARDVLSAEKHLSDIRRKMVDERDRHAHLSDQVDADQERLNQLFEEIGLASLFGLQAVEFDGIAAVLDSAMVDLKRLDSARRERDDAIRRSNELKKEFDDIRLKVRSTLEHCGVNDDISFEVDPSSTSLGDMLKDYLSQFESQNILRAAVSKFEDEIEKRRSDRGSIEQLLELDAEARLDRRRRVDAGLRELEGLSKRLESDQQIAHSELHQLNSEKRLADLQLSLAELEEEIRSLRLQCELLNYLIGKIEVFAKQRAEESKPELHKRVQSMVIKVADDWERLDFDEEGDAGENELTIKITRKDGSSVTDRSLSTGASTLLFTAMRVAIMQQEAADPEAPSIPLLCDDPLVHLDDVRLAQALQLLKDQAVGHQILYFTCKHEIRDLARSIQIPIKEI